MATTLTASLAYSAVQPAALHTPNILRGQFRGAGLSLSGSALLLMAKIPATAKNLQLLVEHELTGVTTNVMNYGVRSGVSTSVTVSVLASGIAADVTSLGGVVDATWDQTAGELFKYVVGSHVSGTVGASLNVNYTIMYDTQ